MYGLTDEIINLRAEVEQLKAERDRLLGEARRLTDELSSMTTKLLAEDKRAGTAELRLSEAIPELTDEQVDEMMAFEFRKAAEFSAEAVKSDRILNGLRDALAFAYMEGFRAGQAYARRTFAGDKS